MSISDIVLKARNSDSFSNIVPLVSLKTKDDVVAVRERGVSAALTVDEFKEKFPGVDVERIYFGNPLSSGAYYWDPETMVIFPLHIIDGHYLALKKMTLEQHIEKGIRTISKDNNLHDYRHIAVSLNDRMRVEYLKMLIDKDIPGIYELFTMIYPICDFGCSTLSIQDMEKLSLRKTPEQVKQTMSALEKLPPAVTVYRGCGSESAPLKDAFSWSLSSSAAVFFATRLTSTDSCIYTASVNREDILEYIDSDEEECIILPDKLFDIKKEEFYDIEWLNQMDYVAAKFLDYRNSANFDRIGFEIDSDIHGKAHCLRVLFFSLLLADLYYLDEEDEYILAEAALYHDTGRRNDGEDRRHGTYSAKKYKRAVKNPNPAVLFLMKYHCKPDSEGYEAIANDEYLSVRRERIEMLFRIFKDADALDRLRLGNMELDYTQLRTDEAKKLPLVSKLTLDGLEV